ncbi:hypothetical protein AB0L13_41285 [Saccharopolyspora shandongensis]|uniref:hypothetical protein n=1 Tax=Saccharopolyspora shandongensis TaxID=418495 RepID=UPI00343D528A
MLARRISPPRPVWINVDALVSHNRGRGPGADKVPMVVRARGVELDRLVPGMQLAWLRSDRGQWLGVVTFSVQTAVGDLPVQQLVPSTAFRPRRPETKRGAAGSGAS